MKQRLALYFPRANFAISSTFRQRKLKTVTLNQNVAINTKSSLIPFDKARHYVFHLFSFRFRTPPNLGSPHTQCAVGLACDYKPTSDSESDLSTWSLSAHSADNEILLLTVIFSFAFTFSTMSGVSVSISGPSSSPISLGLNLYSAADAASHKVTRQTLEPQLIRSPAYRRARPVIGNYLLKS